MKPLCKNSNRAVFLILPVLANPVPNESQGTLMLTETDVQEQVALNADLLSAFFSLGCQHVITLTDVKLEVLICINHIYCVLLLWSARMSNSLIPMWDDASTQGNSMPDIRLQHFRNDMCSSMQSKHKKLVVLYLCLPTCTAHLHEAKWHFMYFVKM